MLTPNSLAMASQFIKWCSFASLMRALSSSFFQAFCNTQRYTAMNKQLEMVNLLLAERACTSKVNANSVYMYVINQLTMQVRMHPCTTCKCLASSTCCARPTNALHSPSKTCSLFPTLLVCMCLAELHRDNLWYTFYMSGGFIVYRHTCTR